MATAIKNLSIPTQVAAALTAPPKKLVAIGPTTDKMIELRDRKRELDAKVKAIDDEYAALEEALFEKLDAEGSTKGAGKNGTCSISSSVVGSVSDWDKFNAYVKKTGFFHLYQRRLSDAAVRELFEQGKNVPGVDPFTKRRLNLRSGV